MKEVKNGEKSDLIEIVTAVLTLHFKFKYKCTNIVKSIYLLMAQ